MPDGAGEPVGGQPRRDPTVTHDAGARMVGSVDYGGCVADGAVRLGIDFGTSTTVAVIAQPNCSPSPLLFDGSPLLASAVCLDPGGRLLVGADAVHTALSSPGAFEPHPKRCIDDGTVLLGGSEVAVGDLLAAVLRRVCDEATVAVGAPPDEVVITCPASWGGERRARLLAAAPPGSVLVSEPAAAAHYFVDVAGHRLPDGGAVVVYDLGAGTFDASVVRREGERFVVLATGGLPDSGGLDIDAAVVTYLGATFADREHWQRLAEPRNAADSRARRQLWDNVRSAKEMLSRVASTMVHIPMLDLDVPLGREQLEVLARPILDRTVAATQAVLADAEVPADELAAIFMAGGSSRMPLVGTVLHHALKLAPTRMNQPELVVAEGSLRAAAKPTAETTAETTAKPAAQPGTDTDWPRPEPVAVAVGTGRSIDWRLRTALFAAAVTVVAVIIAALPSLLGADDPGRGGDETARGSSPAPAPAANTPLSPSSSTPPGIDPCLLGTWQLTSNRVYGLLDNVRVQYEGGGGSVVTYRADGTAFVDYSAMQPRIARHRGSVWADVHRGTTTIRYHAQNGEITSSVISSNAVDTLTRDGRVQVTAPVQYYLEPTKYICTTDRLTSTSAQGNFSSEAVRIRPSTPPRRDPRIA